MTPFPMNSSTPLTPPEPSPLSQKPYASPEMTTLGTIESVTAGPSSSGNLDQLVGSSGGFQADSTS